LDITVQIETACGVPVVSSMPAALWAAARLIGESGYVGPGYGRLLSGTDGQIAS
jgi:maleate cis-trans isomerase